MYRKIIYPVLLVLIALHACQSPGGNQRQNNSSEESKDSTATVMQQGPTEASTPAAPPAFVLDEFGVLTEDDPWMNYVASVNESKYLDYQYIYADGPDNVAFIHIDGKRHFLKVLDWISENEDEEEEEGNYQLTTISQSDDYDVKVVQTLKERYVAGSLWTGTITVTRRSDGAVYTSGIYGSSSH